MNTNTVKILFFEWSDINRTPIGFYNNNDFINFCNDSGITLSKRNHNFLNENIFAYATCKKGKNVLIFGHDKRSFRKNFSKHCND